MDIADQKRVVRRTAITRRARLTADERAAAGEAIAVALLALDELQGDGPVLAFASFGTEVPTDPLIERLLAAGRRVLLPYIDGKILRAAAISSLDSVAPGYRRIREPAEPTMVDPEGVVLVPGVAFDDAGRRLGYGGAFYDAFLEAAPLARPRIGVCFDCQLVDEVPVEESDQPVDLVVTEARIIRAGGG